MREHLYRGKRKRDGVWIYGFYYTTEGKHFILGNENPDSDIQLAYEVIPETVGEYTGLLDKNNVIIFEWDIVIIRTGYCGNPKIKTAERKYVVEWSNRRNYYAGFTPFGCSDIYEQEVVGNIHDNPELLEEHNEN